MTDDSTPAAEVFLTCPDCEEEFELADNYQDGDDLQCPECGTWHETARIDGVVELVEDEEGDGEDEDEGDGEDDDLPLPGDEEDDT